jgi:hypothetical protein
MKTFSLDEAQRLLPLLESLLRRAIEAKRKTETLDAEMQALSQSIFFSGGMLIDTARIAAKREAMEAAIQRAKDSLEEIRAIGVQVKDLDTGLLDFPFQDGVQIVLLCWKLGESKIAHWHTIESGFQGRRPLDERFLKNPDKPN